MNLTKHIFTVFKQSISFNKQNEVEKTDMEYAIKLLILTVLLTTFAEAHKEFETLWKRDENGQNEEYHNPTTDLKSKLRDFTDVELVELYNRFKRHEIMRKKVDLIESTLMKRSQLAGILQGKHSSMMKGDFLEKRSFGKLGRLGGFGKRADGYGQIDRDFLLSTMF